MEWGVNLFNVILYYEHGQCSTSGGRESSRKRQKFKYKLKVVSIFDVFIKLEKMSRLDVNE